MKLGRLVQRTGFVLVLAVALAVYRSVAAHLSQADSTLG
jgi:hypothetical protein